MTDTSDQITLFARHLAESGGLKLWSVLVTCLGDYAQGGVEEVPGPVLSSLVARIGLQSSAMRVALHRLKRDGWVESRHAARVGYFRLSEHGRAQTAAAAEAVYGTPDHLAGPFQLALRPPGGRESGEDAALDPRGLPLGRGAVLGDAEMIFPAGWAVFPLTSDLGSMGWAQADIAEAACEADCAKFTALLERLQTDAEAAPLDHLAQRTLILHCWRRLVLRAHPLAVALLGADSAMAQCRPRVQTWLNQLPRIAVEDIVPAVSA